MVLMSHSSATNEQLSTVALFCNLQQPNYSFAMSKTATNRKAKVTEEHHEEARKLKEIWNSRARETQGVFGEIHKIGNQSAVGQFINGKIPLSLNAAQGFAQGLKCSIADFSPRLAATVQGISAFSGPGWPFEEVDLARWDRLTERQKGQVEKVMNDELDRIEGQQVKANGP